MYDPDMEDYLRDAAFDATHKRYKVKVLVEFTYTTTAQSEEQAESDAYDAIKDALRGSYLDYVFCDFETEDVDES